MFYRIKNLFKKKPKRFVVSGPPPSVGKIEPMSPTWIFMEAWAKSEIESLRRKNDALSLSEHQTTAYRAQIKLLKRILTLSDEKQNGGNGLLNI